MTGNVTEAAPVVAAANASHDVDNFLNPVQTASPASGRLLASASVYSGAELEVIGPPLTSTGAILGEKRKVSVAAATATDATAGADNEAHPAADRKSSEAFLRSTRSPSVSAPEPLPSPSGDVRRAAIAETRTRVIYEGTAAGTRGASLPAPAAAPAALDDVTGISDAAERQAGWIAAVESAEVDARATADRLAERLSMSVDVTVPALALGQTPSADQDRGDIRTNAQAYQATG